MFTTAFLQIYLVSLGFVFTEILRNRIDRNRNGFARFGRFYGETAKVLYGSAFRPHEAGESADRNRKLLKPPSEVVSNLPGFVLDSCGRLKP